MAILNISPEQLCIVGAIFCVHLSRADFVCLEYSAKADWNQ